MNIFQRIWYSIQSSDNDEFLKAIEKKDIEIKALTLLCEGKELSKDELRKELEETSKQVDLLLTANELLLKESDLDNYCKLKYRKIPNIAYKDKMKYNNVYYSVYINELITREAYEVIKLKSTVLTKSNRYSQIKLYGDKVAKITTWTDDKNLDKSGDLYLFPNQVIALKKGDCEDIAGVLASMDIEIGLCWGFYYPETLIKNPTNRFGHAFNCFVYENKLYIIDATSNEGEIEEYTGANHYTINYIVTKDNTYEVDGSTIFGDLAGWTNGKSGTNNKQSTVASNTKKRTTKKLLRNKLKR